MASQQTLDDPQPHASHWALPKQSCPYLHRGPVPTQLGVMTNQVWLGQAARLDQPCRCPPSHHLLTTSQVSEARVTPASASSSVSKCQSRLLLHHRHMHGQTPIPQPPQGGRPQALKKKKLQQGNWVRTATGNSSMTATTALGMWPILMQHTHAAQAV